MTILLVILTGLAFGPLNASANAKPIDYNGASYETVIVKDLSRGGFSALPVNMKTVFEARQGDVRVYFQKEDDFVKIIAPCLTKDQDKSLRILKGSFQ